MAQSLPVKGTQYGKLTATGNWEYRTNGKQRSTYWEVVCECGTVKFIVCSSLTKADGSRCCSVKCSKILDIAPGTVFGRWITTGTSRSKSYEGYNRIEWEARCGCVNDTLSWISSADLRSGKSKGCGLTGCLISVVNSARKMIIRWHRTRVKETNGRIEDRLTDDEIFALSQQPCVLCGGSPSTPVISYQTGEVMTLRNGIDRRNPDEGYTLENSQPCCKRCNYAKHVMTTSDFLGHVSKIYAHSIAPTLQS